MFFVKNNQKGSSLLEALAVLTIISLLGTSVIKLISSIYGLLKQNMVVSEVRDIQKSISGVYNFSGDYKTLFNDDDYYKILCETDKSIPNQICINNGSSYDLVHRLSGKIIIAPNSDYSGYSIEVDQLTKKNCLELVEMNWIDRKKVDIYQLDVNDVTIAYFPKKNDKSFPITMDKALSSCSKSGKNNVIKWYFY